MSRFSSLLVSTVLVLSLAKPGSSEMTSPLSNSASQNPISSNIPLNSTQSTTQNPISSNIPLNSEQSAGNSRNTPPFFLSTKFPPTPVVQPTTIPSYMMNANSVPTPFPLRPYTPSQLSTRQPAAQIPTTIPSAMRSELPGTGISAPVPTLASTDLPRQSALPDTIQRFQMTFDTNYSAVIGSDFDIYQHQEALKRQLSDICSINSNRISEIFLTKNQSGHLVIRISILPGWPVTSDVLKKLTSSMNSTNFLRLYNQPLTSPNTIFWTDDGACPSEKCQNGGLCSVTVDGQYECAFCKPGFSGQLCEKKPAASTAAGGSSSLYALFALLAIIPIVIALIVGFIFGRRKQEQIQLKKKFDLRDVRTIGPRSMLSLAPEQGMRNEMYDTRSFALAFSEMSFAPTGTGTIEKDSSSSSNPVF